jgi:hypothetical protein
MATAANEAGNLQDKWPAHDDQGSEGMDPLGNEQGNGDTDVLHGQDSNNADYAHSTGEDGGNQSTSSYREKQIKVLRSPLMLLKLLGCVARNISLPPIQFLLPAVLSSAWCSCSSLCFISFGLATGV